MLKPGKVLKFSKVTTEPKVMEILKKSWKKPWKVMELKSSKKYNGTLTRVQDQ